MIGSYSLYVLTLSVVSLATLAFSMLKKLVRIIRKIRAPSQIDTVDYDMNKTRSIDMRSIDISDVDRFSTPPNKSALPELPEIPEIPDIPYPVANPWLFQKVAHAFKGFKVKSSD